jgi:hypothetical protein
MGTLSRVAGSAVVLVFLLMTVLRPLFRNPALAAASVDEVFAWPQVLLYAPLLAVVAGIFLLGVLSVVRGDGLPMGGNTDSPGGYRDPTAGGGTAARASDEAKRERLADGPDPSSRFLDGQGGARDAGPDIEEGSPDAGLSDHLEHLRTELGDDPAVREELRTLEDVVSETESEEPVPARCPNEHCDARWTERTMFDVRTGRYELLDEDRAVCLDCESVYRFDDAGPVPVSDGPDRYE